jgi:starch synthase
MIASEVQPYSKTGGLADVVAALPRALGRLGHDVTVVTPRYRGIDAGVWRDTLGVRIDGYPFDVGYFEESLGPGARLLFVDCPPLYHRDGLYNEDNVDYADNALRFAFLSAAAIDWAARQPTPFSLVHAHDWQTGLTPVYLRARSPHSALTALPCIFTVHNLAYQGIFDKEWVPQLSQGWRQPERPRHDRQPDLRRGDPATGVRVWLRWCHAR